MSDMPCFPSRSLSNGLHPYQPHLQGSCRSSGFAYCRRMIVGIEIRIGCCIVPGPRCKGRPTDEKSTDLQRCACRRADAATFCANSDVAKIACQRMIRLRTPAAWSTPTSDSMRPRNTLTSRASALSHAVDSALAPSDASCEPGPGHRGQHAHCETPGPLGWRPAPSAAPLHAARGRRDRQ